MLKLILINGQSGSGKSTLARGLMQSLDNSAHISTDGLTSVNPFEFNELAPLGIKNACLLIQSFREEGYEYIVLCGLLNTQEKLDEFLKNLPGIEAHYFWLKVDKTVRDNRRMKRARDDSDQPEQFDFIDKILPDLKEPLVIPTGQFDFIDANRSVNDILSDIKAVIE
jgi:thymidylate kinase